MLDVKRLRERCMLSLSIFKERAVLPCDSSTENWEIEERERGSSLSLLEEREGR